MPPIIPPAAAPLMAPVRLSGATFVVLQPVVRTTAIKVVRIYFFIIFLTSMVVTINFGNFEHYFRIFY